MKAFRWLFTFAMVVGATYLSAALEDGGDISRFDDELNERDWDALKDYLNTKRTINIHEKACNLTIAGDVRFEWRNMEEKLHGKRVRGKTRRKDLDKVPPPKNDFDIEFNLYFDYVTEGTWAVAHLRFDNSAGVDGCFEDRVRDPEALYGSGYGGDLDLRKAYIGYNVCCHEGNRFDIELGRRKLYQVFDSQVQFLSRFDGILFKYEYECKGLYTLYSRVAGAIVDEKSSHFIPVVEVGALDILCCGLDLKYSFIDWRKLGRNREGYHNPRGAKYMNSQWTVVYHFEPDIIRMPTKVFAGFVCNHAGREELAPISSSSSSSRRTRLKHKKYAWYAGFTIGNVVCQGDWAFNAQYEYVEPFAIPDCDVSGIGIGNVGKNTNTASNIGNSNYKGWTFELLYGLTNNITIDTIYEFSTQVTKRVGGSHSYSKFELESIYAF